MESRYKNTWGKGINCRQVVVLGSTVVCSKDMFTFEVYSKDEFGTKVCSKHILGSVICTIVYSKDVFISIVCSKDVVKPLFNEDVNSDSFVYKCRCFWRSRIFILLLGRDEELSKQENLFCC